MQISNRILALMVVGLLFIGVYQTSAQTVTLPPGGANQRSVTTQYIGRLVSVTVDYNSPDVTGPNGEDRTGKIWDNLCPMD